MLEALFQHMSLKHAHSLPKDTSGTHSSVTGHVHPQSHEFTSPRQEATDLLYSVIPSNKHALLMLMQVYNTNNLVKALCQRPQRSGPDPTITQCGLMSRKQFMSGGRCHTKLSVLLFLQRLPSLGKDGQHISVQVRVPGCKWGWAGSQLSFPSTIPAKET